MAELVLELFSEEIPARMQGPMAEHLLALVTARVAEAGLFQTGVKTFVTPRRLVLTIGGLSLTQEDAVIERRGPRTDAPPAALEGFLRSTGMSKDQLTVRDTGKGEFYFAVQKQRGEPTRNVIMKMLEEIVPALTWPKSMRWGAHDLRWVRPLRNICCVFGGDTLPLKLGHLTANNQSQGHRFLSSGSFTVSDFAAYKKELEKRHVILDAGERKRIVRERADALAAEKNLTVVDDEALLEEVAGLVEWPEVLMGNIDESFMHVPEEVLISAIRTHQKYFCLRARSGKLAPHFIFAANTRASNNNAQVIAGNERVLRARLSDASFFWQQDRKIPLEERRAALARITFHALLGTVAEKTERVQALAKFLAVWVPHANLEMVERAALLAKADLTTGMVGEFPELQGLMGYYYASASGEPEDIALAVKEHYAPAGQEDKVPSRPVSVTVAIADKVDTLAGLFAAGEKPSGSKDPFALRRAALGVIRIVLENKISVPLSILIERALRHYPSALFKEPENEEADEKPKRRRKLIKTKVKPSQVVSELMLFFSERLKALLKAENVRHDLIAAVFDSGNEDDLLRVVQRVAALDRFLRTPDGADLLAAYRRAVNIVRIEEKRDGDQVSGKPAKKLLMQEEEKTLHGMMQELAPSIAKALKEHNFEAAMGLLSKLRSPIDAFFGKVTVNCDQPELRKNRLRLLAQMRELLDGIADFSKIEG